MSPAQSHILHWRDCIVLFSRLGVSFDDREVTSDNEKKSAEEAEK